MAGRQFLSRRPAPMSSSRRRASKRIGFTGDNSRYNRQTKLHASIEEDDEIIEEELIEEEKDPETVKSIPKQQLPYERNSSVDGFESVLSPQYSVAEQLKEELQRFRTQQSKSLSKPAYTILTNASIEGICESMPTTKEALLKIKGIGPKKAEMFGTNILTMVSSYKDGSIETTNETNGIKALTPSIASNSPSETNNNSPKKLKYGRKTQLRDDLKEYRVLQAEPMNKPAYVIFTNAALEGIVALVPTTEAQLLEVKGIGPKKVEMFGDDILRIVAQHLESSGDDSSYDSMPHISARPTTIDRESLTSEQQRAADIALSKDRNNIFITGSAGTGKSYLLKYLVQELRQTKDSNGELNVVSVAAPTGVAAVIVGGSTLHSFFGVGLGTGSIPTLLTKVRNNKNAKKRISDTDVLIIDECSMVSSDLLEKLDGVAREIRKDGFFRDFPFGGMQVIAFGDFFQLPPIQKRDGWHDNDRAFCFNSDLWSDLGFDKNIVELQEVQRQEDDAFITLLNRVRVGEVDENDVEFLNSKCLVSKMNPLPADGILPTRLYVLNKDVDSENISRLSELKGEEIVCRAIDTWKESLPIGTNIALKKQMKDGLAMEMPDEVRLKVGAQVMLTRNKDLEKNLVNGSRGVVERIVQDGDLVIPIVRFDNGVVTRVPPVESMRYNPDGGEGCLVRMQVPLKLAWAITIHKSQGSTLTRALLDVSSSFEFGQCYVALSRVKNLEGLWLERPARLNNIMVSPQVVEFFR